MGFFEPVLVVDGQIVKFLNFLSVSYSMPFKGAALTTVCVSASQALALNLQTVPYSANLFASFSFFTDKVKTETEW